VAAAAAVRKAEENPQAAGLLLLGVGLVGVYLASQLVKPFVDPFKKVGDAAEFIAGVPGLVVEGTVEAGNWLASEATDVGAWSAEGDFVRALFGGPSTKTTIWINPMIPGDVVEASASISGGSRAGAAVRRSITANPFDVGPLWSPASGLGKSVWGLTPWGGD